VGCEFLVHRLETNGILDNVVVIPDLFCGNWVSKKLLSIVSIKVKKKRGISARPCTEQNKSGGDILLFKFHKSILQNSFERKHDFAEVAILKFLPLQLGPLAFPHKLGQHTDFFQVAS